jgi:uncharacterized protein YihD (DUF1040 family)
LVEEQPRTGIFIARQTIFKAF